MSTSTTLDSLLDLKSTLQTRMMVLKEILEDLNQQKKAGSVSADDIITNYDLRW